MKRKKRPIAEIERNTPILQPSLVTDLTFRRRRRALLEKLVDEKQTPPKSKK